MSSFTSYQVPVLMPPGTDAGLPMALSTPTTRLPRRTFPSPRKAR
jgi:hypothetical protein